MLRTTALIIGWNFIAVCILLAIAEFGARWYLEIRPNLDLLRFLPAALRTSLFPDPSRIIDLEGPSKWFKDDSDVGWLHKPGQRIRQRSGKHVFQSQVNDAGIHTPSDPPADQIQVVTIGDSFLAGNRTARPIAWQMEERLNLNIYNLAAGGWGPGNYLNAFKKFAAGRNSPVVVVFSFVNDAIDAGHFLKWEQSGKAMSYHLFKVNRRWYSVSGNAGTTWLDTHSALYNILKFSVGRVLSIDFRQSDRSVLRRRLERRREAVGDSYTDSKFIEETLVLEEAETRTFLRLKGMRYFLICDKGEFLEGGLCNTPFEKYKSYMDRLHREIKRSGGQMLLVWIPTMERLYYPYLRTSRQLAYGKVAKEDGLVGAEIVIDQYARSRSIAFLDLTAALQDSLRTHLQKGELLYFEKDGHFNENGTGEVARLVSERVRALLGERAQP